MLILTLTSDLVSSASTSSLQGGLTCQSLQAALTTVTRPALLFGLGYHGAAPQWVRPLPCACPAATRSSRSLLEATACTCPDSRPKPPLQRVTNNPGNRNTLTLFSFFKHTKMPSGSQEMTTSHLEMKKHIGNFEPVCRALWTYLKINLYAECNRNKPPVPWQKTKYRLPVHTRQCNNAQDVKTEVSYQIPGSHLTTQNLGIFPNKELHSTKLSV